jgi:sigma-B regulation protein RsbU (phosphoserine phosphatase)
LFGVAILLFATATLYSALWMLNARSWTSVVELGFNRTFTEHFDKSTHSILVGDVVPGSPAEKVGLRAGDRIIAVNERPLDTSGPYDEAYAHGKPGDPIELTVSRPGESQPVVLHAVFRARASMGTEGGLAKSSAQEIVNSFPVLFLLIGLAVLFLRLDDPYAWLLAVMFIAFAAAADLPNTIFLSDNARTWMFVYRAVWNGLLLGIFNFCFAVFPVRSRLDRAMPWLKWAGLVAAGFTVLPAFKTGVPTAPEFVSHWIGRHAANWLVRGERDVLLVLGMVSLADNAFGHATAPEARRKSRVLFWGTALGVLPIVVLRLASDLTGYEPSYWINTPAVIILILYPLSFAYAVVKHRVLEIPVLLRRSARYVLVQRGYFVLLFCTALLTIFLFTHLFSGLFVENSQIGMGLSAAFGVALVWVSGPIVKKGTDRIDRAFFRSAYDARMILQDLADRTRTVTERHELARLLESHIEGALHPKSLACYLASPSGDLVVDTGRASTELGKISFELPRPKFPFPVSAQFALRDDEIIPASLPLLEELARAGKAWDVPLPVSTQGAESNALAPECLVPIVGRNSKLMGLLVLGPRLSEEPYSGEDKQLLDSVAGQAAVALENMKLAQEMASRLELDRRAEREMQIAREVQSRLFPQMKPRLATLDYAGSCLQARQVGGDYYDFWDFGSTHLAMVLADISGKGISGALLMANLQANLRSRTPVARQEMLNLNHEGQWLPGLLKSVNQLFYENTPDDRYATLFFAVYDDTSHQLEYVNCGHNPPLLVRAKGCVERLEPTAGVIGISLQFECATQSITLQPDDILVIYTDGVTEANDPGGNEFGEQRLEKVVRENSKATPEELLAAIQDAVREFSAGGEQFDDLTLVVARAM